SPAPNAKKICPSNNGVRYPKRWLRNVESATPKMEVANCAVNRCPACASLSDHRADSTGSMGPTNVVITPVITKPGGARTVVAVLEWLPAFGTKHRSPQ